MRNPKNPYALIYFSENSTFIEDFPKLNLLPQDFRIVVVPFTRIPRSLLTADLRKVYKAYGMQAFTTKQKIPIGRNVVFDISSYIRQIDLRFKPTNYRQRAGFLVNDALRSAFRFFTNDYEQILLYTVDLTKGFDTFINRKIFPIVQQMKDEDVFFENMLMNTITQQSSRYRLLVKNGDYNFRRVFQYLRNIKPISISDEVEKESEEGSKEVMKAVKDTIGTEYSDAVKGAIEDYLEDDKAAREKVQSGSASDLEIKRIAAASILYRVSGDYDGARRIARSINTKNSTAALKAIDKAYSDELLKPEKTVSLSSDPRIQVYDVAKMNGNKSPEHILQKRRIDFERNLREDLTNAFKVLETKDPPLKFVKLEIVDKKQRAGELTKSDLSVVSVTLRDKNGNDQVVTLEIPKINPNTGTFRVYGQTKVLINQIVQDPITFPEPGASRFESSYSKFRIYSKRLRTGRHLEAFMIYRIPFLFLLSLLFGFEQSLKKYGIKYRVVEERPKGEKYWARIHGGLYVIFENVESELQQQLILGFMKGEPDKYGISQEFPSKEYFVDLIQAFTGRVNSVYMIENNAANIVDPVSVQVLRNKQQPTKLEDIMKYMAEKVIDGYMIPRNDITNQRIRNSEVLVYLAQKQILAAYTTYREQVLSGSEDAKLSIIPTKVLSEFNKTELSMSMEYANPIEEISTLTRVSPSGKKVGGIPDKRSIGEVWRNLHDSYYGNIDPLDTPEGGNIGIVQQLTIDALITSSRGLFANKKMTNNENSGLLSSTTCMTPFLENNDGARVIMLANQAKQMLPLKNPEPPIVQSGYESILTNVLSDNFVKRSPCNGKILKITKDYIRIKCTGADEKEVDISPTHLRSGSGKNTLSVFRPTVVEGRTVKKNDVIAEGACMSGGSISLGRPLLVAFMPYKGYNFEDGIVINERMITEEKLTSLHGIEEEIMLSEEDRLLEIANIGDKLEKGDILLRKTIGEIEQLIGYEEDETSDIQSGQFIKRSQAGRIVDIEVYSNVPADIFPQLKELINKTNRKYGKPAKEKFSIRGETIKGVKIVFRIEQELKIGLGDKLCNRHGNKGIIALVESDRIMPRTPFGTVDVILNPIGILGRMNMGQVYEMYCGLMAKELGNRIPNMTQKQAIDLIRKLYSHLDKSKNKETTARLIANIGKLSGAQYKLFVENIKRSGFYPIVIPPFQAPNNLDIEKALKVLGLKSGYKLKLPEFNTTTAQEVPVGYMYISKLEHLGSEKIYGRSTGPTVGKTAQPTAGKRREGAQRVGELDSYAFISYNCPNVLAEMMGPLSDDYITRDEIISEIIQNGEAGYKEAKISPARDLLNAYFTSLMLTRG
jgi:hypothetical protein